MYLNKSSGCVSISQETMVISMEEKITCKMFVNLLMYDILNYFAEFNYVGHRSVIGTIKSVIFFVQGQHKLGFPAASKHIFCNGKVD